MMELKILEDGELRVEWEWDNNGTRYTISQGVSCLPLPEIAPSDTWEQILLKLEAILKETAKINL